MLDLQKAKKTAEDFKKFDSDPKGLYIECEKRHMSLTAYLETMDPTELNMEGRPAEGHDAFDRLMMAKDIRLSGQNAFTLDQLMATGNEMLAPELIKREVEHGMAISAANYKNLVATEVMTNQATDHPIYLPDLNLDTVKNRKEKSLAVRASTNKGGEFPVFSLRHREKDVMIGDYGRAIEAPYSMLKGRAWPELRVFFWLLGAQIAADKVYDIYLLGVNGDGTVGAATDLFNGTAGALTYKDLVHAYSGFGDPFQLNAFICPQVSYEAILTMAQFTDPNMGWEFQKTGKPVTPMGAVVQKVGATPGGTPTGTVIVCLDKRFAVKQVSSQNLMVEAEKIIERKFEKAVISEETAFTIIADGAIKQLIWT